MSVLGNVLTLHWPPSTWTSYPVASDLGALKDFCMAFIYRMSYGNAAGLSAAFETWIVVEGRHLYIYCLGTSVQEHK
jgi:hypothetical protein